MEDINLDDLLVVKGNDFNGVIFDVIDSKNSNRTYVLNLIYDNSETFSFEDILYLEYHKTLKQFYLIIRLDPKSNYILDEVKVLEPHDLDNPEYRWKITPYKL